jgi:2-iminobutanoate/2-iminopropanoate deaminase
MSTKPVSSPAAPKAIGPYSQALLVERGGEKTLYSSGQIPLDPVTGELVQGDIALQTERVMQNLEAVLAAAGMSFGEVVRTTVYLVDLGEFARMNEVYGRRFGGAPPARSTVQVAALPRGARVEIDVIATSGAGKD